MNRYAVAAGVAVVQLALTGVAVAPQLSARLTGDTYLMRVAPVDPIDPFRGAYVVLDYPDLRPGDARGRSTDFVEGGSDTVHVVLTEEDGVMVASDWSSSRPATSPTSPAATTGGRSAAASRAGSSPRTRRAGSRSSCARTARSPSSGSTPAATPRSWDCCRRSVSRPPAWSPRARPGTPPSWR